jgi:inosine-uridine nucleoside N-ribohydrolase
MRSSGRVGALVAELLEFYGRFHAQTYGFAGSPIHDAVAVAHVLRPGIVETKRVHVAIETQSELCRGRTVADVWRRTANEPNAHVGVDIDAHAFVELLVERIGALG